MGEEFFSFGGRGILGYSKLKVPTFHFQWGGCVGILGQMRIGILHKISEKFAIPNSGGPFITDSVSHTMCVEI